MQQLSELSRARPVAAQPRGPATASIWAGLASSRSLGGLGLAAAGGLGLTGGLTSYERAIGGITKSLGIAAAVDQSGVFGLRGGFRGFELGSASAFRNPVRDVTAFSSLRRQGRPYAALAHPLWPSIKFSSELLSEVGRRQSLRDLTGALSVSDIARGTTLPHAEWWRSRGSLEMAAGGIRGGLVSDPARMYRAQLAAFSGLETALGPTAFGGVRDALNRSGLLGAMAGVDGRRLSGLAAGLDAGPLARRAVTPSLRVAQQLRISSAIARSSSVPPQALLEQLTAEALALRDVSDDPATSEAQTVEDDSLLAAAIAMGRRLVEATSEAEISAVQWVGSEPLWWAPSLVNSWPALTPEQRVAVRNKAAAASSALLGVAYSAAAGELVLCIIGVLGAYAAINDFYALVRRLDQSS